MKIEYSGLNNCDSTYNERKLCDGTDLEGFSIQF
jgi:hypothetical protein